MIPSEGQLSVMRRGRQPDDEPDYTAGMRMSPNVLTPIIPPRNMEVPINRLMLPDRFSGAHTCVRRKLCHVGSFESLARGWIKDPAGVAPLGAADRRAILEIEEKVVEERARWVFG